MAWTLVGIDCASQEEHMGLARGTLDKQGGLRVERVTLGTAGESAEGTVAGWLAGQPRHVIALNAPLGWPASLGKALAKHAAGLPLALPRRRRSSGGNASPPEDMLLRRHTERVVQSQTGRAPTETTAERQTRRALAALALLGRLRAASDHALELAWDQGEDAGVIEVRTRATLRAHGLRPGAYRGRTHKARHEREQIFDFLTSQMRISARRELLTENADMLDASIGVLAAADFVRGACLAPDEPELARSEGWIWLRTDGQGSLF